jgi:hypothetical protein
LNRASFYHITFNEAEYTGKRSTSTRQFRHVGSLFTQTILDLPTADLYHTAAFDLLASGPEKLAHNLQNIVQGNGMSVYYSNNLLHEQVSKPKLLNCMFNLDEVVILLCKLIKPMAH